MNIKIKTIYSIIFLFFSNYIFAASYVIPPDNESLIGRIQYKSSEYGDNVITVAQHYNLGYNAIENANPYLDLSRGFNPGTLLQIPTEHLLPNLPRKGIVINLPEMRMYYYPAGSTIVLTYPIGIGKIGKTIPLAMATVTKKMENPSWTPPEDIREFNLEQGIVLPQVMPPGPDNPLGPYAIYMSIPTYLIHSTIFPESVGRRASFGCIRMYESDIKTFFPSIKKGIPVVIVNNPIKIGWQRDHLYMEAYKPLEENDNEYNSSLPGIVKLINDETHGNFMLIDWQMVTYLSNERDGIPHEIGMKIH